MPLHPVIESALRASTVRPYRELGVALARVLARSRLHCPRRTRLTPKAMA